MSVTLQDLSKHLSTKAEPLMDLDQAKALVASVPHWHHRFEIFPGLITPGSYEPAFLFDKAKLPDDLHGHRVLDIGTSDGYVALQLAKRGAQVVAVDYRRKQDHGYHVMEMLNPVDIEYHHMNVYELLDKNLGQFDIVFFMGVLYHLPDMLRALHMVRQVCRGAMFLETHSENEFCQDVAAARYYSGASLAGDHTNFWAPNRLCVIDMLHDAGFDVESDEAWSTRLFVKATAVATSGLRAIKMQLGYGVLGT